MRALLLGLGLAALACAAHAQSTAAQVLPGMLVTVGCPPGYTVCYVPYSSANPLPIGGTGVTSTNNSGSIITGGTFQTLLAANAARKGCLIQNPTTATEPLYVSVAVATASASIAKSYSLAPGASFSCASGLAVITDNIAVTAATTAHAFVETDQ